MAHVWRGVLREYADRLGVTDASTVVTLGEGGTPLLPAPALSRRTGADVWVKFEGMNPTGSFKDRGMTVAVSRASDHGAKAVICASTGNTSASAAAYAAHAGIKAAVLVPEGKIAMGKLSQAVAHNGELIQIRGNFDDCLEIARELADRYPVHLVNSVNPDRIDGQKTAAYEVVETLGDAPDFHFLPVGNAGNYTAYSRGYREEADRGISTRVPRMFGFQAAGSAPLVIGEVVKHPETIASAIASATRHRGSSRSRRGQPPTAGSARSTTPASSRPRSCSPERSGSSSSPPLRSASPDSSTASRPVWCRPVRAWCSPSRVTA